MRSHAAGRRQHGLRVVAAMPFRPRLAGDRVDLRRDERLHVPHEQAQVLVRRPHHQVKVVRHHDNRVDLNTRQLLRARQRRADETAQHPLDRFHIELRLTRTPVPIAFLHQLAKAPVRAPFEAFEHAATSSRRRPHPAHEQRVQPHHRLEDARGDKMQVEIGLVTDRTTSPALAWSCDMHTRLSRVRA